MMLPANSIISERKVKEYLLSFRNRNDKSKWLAKAGYDVENWKRLEHDIRRQLLIREAVLVEENKFGDIYEITGTLNGPNGKSLQVRSIWMYEYGTKMTKFITMYPLQNRG
jgi:hypothetical protein